MSRPPWLILAAGAVIGFAVGLAYAWVLSPVRYVETAPDSLRDAYRQEYLALIAAAYAGTGDLDRAEARLSLFDLEDPVEVLTALAQERLAQEGQEGTARALARLAADLGAIPLPTTAARGPSVETRPPSAALSTATLAPTERPPATPTASPAPLPPFALARRERVCDPQLDRPLLQVEVVDADEAPVPGVEVVVLSDVGEDHFFTGLKPELGLGYGDFEMDPERTYTVQIGVGQVPVTGIASESCQLEEGDRFWGSVRLRFRESEG